MNYIEAIVDDLAAEARAQKVQFKPSGVYTALFRHYAVLVLTTGVNTTNENVHDAWSAWQTETVPEHRSLVPFDELREEVQELDSKYRDLIIAVAEKRA